MALFKKSIRRAKEPAPREHPRMFAKAKVGHIGHRRQDCWWEPIYDPDLKITPDAYDWDLKRDAGPSRRFIAGETLDKYLSPGDTFKVDAVTFKECDFQGLFSANPLIMFDECRFIGCDFAYSNWKSAHFRKCLFEDTSLSLASFEKCEFRECIWRRVGIASKTEFVKTFVSNPGALIDASVSLTNPKDKTWRHRANQWYRNRGTRAHVLRSLMLSHSVVGDEHVYYETVRIHELHRCEARMAEDLFNIIFLPIGKKIVGLGALAIHALDFVLMGLLGLTNKWGESVSRPCVIFGMTFLSFAEIYKYGEFRSHISQPFQKSFDITLLAGYSDQIAPNDSFLSIVEDVHVMLAVILYTVLFSTMISKLSRAR